MSETEFAFPQSWYGHSDEKRELTIEGGMSLRDYFAAKAMTGAMAQQDTNLSHPTLERDIAKLAYKVADAMIAERSK